MATDVASPDERFALTEKERAGAVYTAIFGLAQMHLFEKARAMADKHGFSSSDHCDGLTLFVEEVQKHYEENHPDIDLAAMNCYLTLDPSPETLTEACWQVSPRAEHRTSVLRFVEMCAAAGADLDRVLAVMRDADCPDASGLARDVEERVAKKSTPWVPHVFPPSRPRAKFDPATLGSLQHAAFFAIKNLYLLGEMTLLDELLDVYDIPVDVYDGNNEGTLLHYALDVENDGRGIDLATFKFCSARAPHKDTVYFLEHRLIYMVEEGVPMANEALVILVDDGATLVGAFEYAAAAGVDFLVAAFPEQICEDWVDNAVKRSCVMPTDKLERIHAHPVLSLFLTPEREEILLRRLLESRLDMTPERAEQICYLVRVRGVDLGGMPPVQRAIAHTLLRDDGDD